MQLANNNQQSICPVKIYGAPSVEIVYFYGNDVVTASDPNDNNFSDLEDWD